MNTNVLCYAVLAFACFFGPVISRALPQAEAEGTKLLSRSKRSQSADHSINDKVNRRNARLARQLHLLNILKQVDTSGRLPSSLGHSNILATTTTRLNNPLESGSGSRLSSRGRKEKQRNRRKNNGKKHLNKRGRKSRKRRTRAVADDIVNLLESEHGEDILRAIAGALNDDYEYSDNVEDLEKFVRSSSKKCKCSLPRKPKV